jgi:hypothetical protein
MAKIIKKIGNVFIIIAAVLIMVPAITFLLLQTSRVQTCTVNKLTKVVTEKTGAPISIGKVSYTFFRRLVLEDVLFEDQNGDTLLAVKKLELGVRELKLSEGILRFGRADVYEPDFRLIQDTTGVMNLTRYLESLFKDKIRDTTKKTSISFPDIDVFDGAFSLIDMNDTTGTLPGTVNLKKMRITSVNGKIRDLLIVPDSVSMVLRGIAFAESGGFMTRSLDMNTTVTDNGLFFRDIELLTDSSAISAEKILLLPEDKTAWADFIHGVRMDFLFNSSVVDASDLAYFISPLRDLGAKFNLSGRISGTVAELKGRNIKIDYGDFTRLRFDFDISGLPRISESYLYIDFTDMRTSAIDIEQFVIPDKKPLQLPAIVHDLGLISYNGSFTGFTTNFVSFGRLTTERGDFSTDLSLRPDGKNTFSFKGFLRTSDVDLGYVTRNDEMFGKLSMHADIDGSMQSFKHLSANITGVIDSVEINDYLYRNVAVSGRYADRIWDGNVAVKDKNIRMEVMGRFDIEKSRPEFDFSLNLAHADLHALNLVKNDTIFEASALLTANFKGNRSDNLEGDMRLINSTLQNSNGKLSIYDFLITSAIVNGSPLLRLKSDFADAEVTGPYTFEAISTTVRTIMANLFPSKFKLPEVKQGTEPGVAMFALNARMKRIDKLNEFLGTGLSISEGSQITGHFWSDHPEMIAEMKSEAITYAGTTLAGMHLTASAVKSKMGIEITADTIRLPDNSKLCNFILESGSNPDTINLGLRWDNKDGGRTLGEIKATGFYSLNGLNKPVLTIGILPASITVNSNRWDISPARIVLDSTNAYFDNLLLSSHTHYIRLDGRLSPSPQDRLTLSFDGLNMSYLNNLGKSKSDKPQKTTPMTFEGMLKGDITLSDVYNNLLFESNINVSDFKLNSNSYGMVSIRSEWNPLKKVAVIEVFNDYQGHKSIDINGTYSPTSKLADLSISTFNLPLDIINPFVGAFASNVNGVASGTVNLRGKLKQLELSGSLMARDASMKIDFLQTRYSFSDSIRFTPAGIVFRNIRIYDEKRNQGTINGILTHNSFKDIGISLDINLDRMLVLNTRPKDSDIFYGTAYASGYAGIRGNEDKLTFNISARTAPNTEFIIPLNSSASVSDYPYIVFVNPVRDKENDVRTNQNLFERQQAQSSNIELNFDLDVTPEAEVQLILDETSGGVIRGKGAGKLNINLNSKGDVRMAGDYVISEGDYLFTLGNILNKRFTIEEGGTITWNGNIDDADLNLRAIYRSKASLSDIFNEEEFPELKERLPVECILNLSGKLLNPAIKFDILLPTADDRTREYLRMATDTEEEMSRQFLYLLVMNSFYPDPALFNASSPNTGGGQISQTDLGAQNVGFTTTTEMLSNQLSNWLSQISNDFDIGFNYRPGNLITNQEVEVALSTQLLNDKVTLNGNVDVGGNQSNTKYSNISGEFTIELKLTDMLRLKAFNRSNNNLFYKTNPYTQGVGIFFRRDFDTLKDLFIKPEEKRKKVIRDGKEKDGQ